MRSLALWLKYFVIAVILSLWISRRAGNLRVLFPDCPSRSSLVSLFTLAFWVVDPPFWARATETITKLPFFRPRSLCDGFK